MVGKENLFAWIKANNTPYWTLYNSTSNAKLAESPDTDNYGLEESINNLDTFLGFLGNKGRYYIVAKQTPDGTKKGVFKTSFELAQSQQPTAQLPGMYGIGGNIDEVVEKRVKEAVEKYQLKHQLDMLTEKFNMLSKEAEEGKESTFEKVLTKAIGKIEPFLPQMMGLQNPSVAVSGFDDMMPEEKKLEQALERLHAVDENFINNLDKLSRFAEANPEVFKQNVLPLIQNL